MPTGRQLIAILLALACAWTRSATAQPTSCPEFPNLIGTIGMSGSLAITGDVVLSSTFSTLSYYSLADPAHPRLAASVAHNASVIRVAPRDRFAYLGALGGFLGYTRFDDVDSPSFLGWTAAAQVDFLLALDDGCVVLTNRDGIRFYALLPGGLIQFRRFVPAPFYFNDIEAMGDRVYVSHYSSELMQFQHTSGGDFIALESIPIPSIAYNLGSFGSELYVVASQRLLTFDMSDPDGPNLLQDLSVSNVGEPVRIGNLLLAGTRILPRNAGDNGWDAGVVRADLGRRAVGALGDLMVASYSPGTLRVLEPPRPIAYPAPNFEDFQLGGELYALTSEGDRLLIAAGRAGMHELQFDAAGTLTPLRTVPTEGTCLDVALAEGFVVVAEYESGLACYAWSEEAGVGELLSRSQWGGPVRCVELQDRLAYVGADERGVLAIDLDDPRHPQALGAVSMAGAITDLELAGTSLAVARLSLSPLIVDVSQSNALSVRRDIGRRFRGQDLAYDGDRLVIAGRTDGFAIYDGDPAATGGEFLAGSSDVRSVALDDRYLYLATAGTLGIMDRRGTVTGSFFTWSTDSTLLYQIALVGDWIFLLSSSGHVRYLPRPCVQIAESPRDALEAARETLTTLFPNPSSGPRTIEVNAPGTALLSLRLFDARGRLVWEQPRTTLRRIEWDGRDLSGQSVAAGVYYMTTRLGLQTRTQKLVVLQQGGRP